MKKSIIAAVAVFLAVVGVFILTSMAIKSKKTYKVTYFSEVKSEVGADGKAAVGSPAVYQVGISPALAWEKGDGAVKFWRIIAIIALIASAVYIGLASSGIIEGSIHLSFVGLAISLACYFAAYSSAFSSNYKELSEKEYMAIKDSPEAMQALFDKPLIK